MLFFIDLDFQIKMSKLGEQDKMLKISDCNLPNPQRWPGKFSKDNTRGTLMVKEEWIKKEAKLWFDEMKKNEKYDSTWFSVKVVCLLGWLKKGFPKLTTKEMKKLLYELEENAEKEKEIEERPGEVNSQMIDEQMETENDNHPGTPDMFDSDGSEQMEEDYDNLNRKEREILIKEYTDKMCESLLENDDSLPDFVSNSRVYKKRKEDFIKEYVDKIFETTSSQGVAIQMSQYPEFTKSHQYIHEKLSHRSRTELSSWRVLKNVNDMLRELKKDPSLEAYNHRVMLTASTICPRYGVPNIDESRNVIDAAKKLNKRFFGGEQSTLQVEANKKKEFFPTKVFEFASESWDRDATIPEPAQHARPESAMSDGTEKMPARLQVLTDD